ncbi:MAG: ATPase [Sphingomonadaceae bacterium]|nr:ATPase [Sphingomonadaceae bacterium]
MKRFYRQAEATAAGAGWGVALDGNPTLPPFPRPFAVPTRALAEAIAAEWNAQGEVVDPHSMLLNGLANSAIDVIAPDRPYFVNEYAAYGGTDLLCYRAAQPAELVARQARAWDPLLDWARRRFDIKFEVVTGIVHRPQPAATIERLTREVAALDPFRLAALAPLVKLGGSLVAALALTEGAFEEDEVWAAVNLDEEWQMQQWGEMPEAIAALGERRRNFAAAIRMWRLLDQA